MEVACWSAATGLFFLIIGLIAARPRWSKAQGVDKLIILGPSLTAASLATFGAEHFAAARSIAQMVPSWMPAHLFWTCFVGGALIASALSLSSLRAVHWSAPLLALMFFLFILLLHLPGVASHPRNRIYWIVLLRELAFTGGVLALAGAISKRYTRKAKAAIITVGQVFVALALLVFGVEHYLHPYFVLGVPLDKVAPTWVPFRPFWAYCVGTILLLAGGMLIIGKCSRLAATAVGILMITLTLLFYLPILATDRGPSQVMEGVNYVADTLLFGGSVLLLSMALALSGISQLDEK